MCRNRVSSRRQGRTGSARTGLPSALAGSYEGGEFKVADAALDGTRVAAARTVQVVASHRIELAHHRVHQRLYAA